MGHRATNDWAREVLAANEPELVRLVPQLIELVAAEVGLPAIPADHKFPVDIIGVTREFLATIASDELDSIGEPGTIFERLGTESARGGIPFKVLARAIRVSNRRIQAQVHRALIADGRMEDTESTLELLARVFTAGEMVVTAARQGYERAALKDPSDDEALRQLASALINGSARAVELATAVGWAPDGRVCVIVTSPEDAADIRLATGHKLADFSTDDEVVLIHPVDPDRLATSLRAELTGTTCVVGSAVTLTEVPGSLSLTNRLSTLVGSRSGAVFADDYLLELACSADASVVSALRRKYFAELDTLPEEHRTLLVETLRQWLLHWGHRPGIAEALDVHPQTVSGRINRLKDLIADDLEGPKARAELLVLLIAEGVA